MLFPSEYIYVLNIAVVLIIALFAYSGYRQGFLLKALGCFGFLVCGLLSWFLSSPLAKVIPLYPKDMTPMADTIAGPIFYESLNRSLMFIVLFIILSIIVLFLKPILKAVGKLPILQEVNVLLGTLIGALQGLVAVMVLSFVFTTPLFANGIHIVEDSFLKPINAITEGLLFFADDTIGELKSIQKIVTPSTMLNQEDLNHIKNWLLDHDLDEAKVNQLVQQLAGE